MTTPVGESKALIDLPAADITDTVPIPSSVPRGIGAAPTVLEEPKNAKSEKPLEPGVFETIVVAIKDFIIFLFISLWNCLFKKTEEPKKTAEASVQTDPPQTTPSLLPEDVAGKKLEITLVPSRTESSNNT